MILRKIKFEDWKLVLDWRNDPISVQYSITKEKIQEEPHKKWLKENIHDNFFIAEVDKIPVGTIRGDLKNNEYVLSWSISPNHRGKGYGTLMLQKCIDILPKNNEIIAYILKENKASIKMAQKVGLIKNSDKNNILKFKYNKMTDLEIIDAVEAVRTKNNKNWMDILRVAFKHSPEEARPILAEINKSDGEISRLLDKLANNK